MSELMTKHEMTEEDIKLQYITPAIESAGWDKLKQIKMEYNFTDGRVIVRGNVTARGKRKRTDYLLYYKPNIPLAIVEAKDNRHSVGAGMQQAIEYAEVLDIPFVYSSNGDGFLEHDMKSGKERELMLEQFPSPHDLWQRHIGDEHFTPEQEQLITEPYYFQLGDKTPRYRKTLSALRTKISIIENNLREKDYTFDYSKQPSKAMFKYRKAFMRNDGDRYDEFMSRVAEGTEQLHTGTLTPYEMIKPFFGRGDISDQERKAIDATWKTQEDFTGGENALVVIDGSGSMYGGADPIPATVALSLGIYYAELNTGAFQNHFITFSENPKLVEIKGKDIYEKVRYCHQFNEVANTNIQRVFELILKTAVKNRVPQKDMPAKIFIISDMEFDYCTEDCSLTNFEYAQRLFEEHGYQLPEVMFWNVASRNQQQPVKINDQGVALVSGCNPRIFSMLKAGILSPYAFMMDVLGSERYAAIVA